METKLLLSPAEVGAALGVKRSTVFKLLQEGQIMSIKVGRLRRVPVDALRTWVEKQVALQQGGDLDAP